MAQVPADETCWSTASAVDIEVKAERTDEAERAGGWPPRPTKDRSNEPSTPHYRCRTTYHHPPHAPRLARIRSLQQVGTSSLMIGMGPSFLQVQVQELNLRL